MYDQKQIRDQTREQYTMSYITDKLIPMWPDGWMKFNDIHNGFMPKVPKESKKSNDVKTSKSTQPTVSAPTSSVLVDSIKDGGVSNTEKKKSHIQKDSTKSTKTTNEKPTLPKTDKKHSAVSITDRATIAAASLLSMPIGDGFNPKSV